MQDSGAGTVQQKPVDGGLRKDEVIMKINLREAADLLNITLLSLLEELKKPNCPYGYSYVPDGKVGRVYFVSRERLEKWIEENPSKYHNHPDYTTREFLALQ